MSFRSSLTLIFLGLTLAVLAAFSASFYYLERQSVTATQKDNERKTLEKLSAACREAEMQLSAIGAINFVNLLKREPAVRAASCIGSQERIIAHTASSNIGRPISEQERAMFLNAQGVHEEVHLDDRGAEILTLAVPIRIGAKKAGLARIDYDMRFIQGEIDKSLLGTLRRVMAISSAIFLLAFLAALMLAEFFAHPIKLLVKGTQEIGDGKLDHKIEIGRHINELMLLGDKFNDMAFKLSEVDRLKASFLENVTHDMRAPLQAVSGYVELILLGNSGPLTAKQALQLNVIVDNVKKLSEFISDMLDLTRLEAQNLEIERHPVLLQDSIESVREMLQASAEQYKITVNVDCDEELPVLYGDPKLLDRLITNLAHNAFKFTPAGGTVTLRAQRHDSESLRLEVQDDGIGIPEDKLKSVFEKFFQVQETRHLARNAGTGLGLTIVKGIVELHKGKIWAESPRRKGTSFIVVLPTANPASTQTDSRGS